MNLIKALEQARKADHTVYVTVGKNGVDYAISNQPPDKLYHYFRVGRYGVEWVKNEGPESASTHYSGLYLELRELLDEISGAAFAHKKRFDGLDYGYPGDLGAVNEKLRQALEHLGG